MVGRIDSVCPIVGHAATATSHLVVIVSPSSAKSHSGSLRPRDGRPFRALPQIECPRGEQSARARAVDRARGVAATVR